MNKLIASVLMLTLVACTNRPGSGNGADSQQSDTTAAAAGVQGQGQLLSAFFGLDNGLPMQANLGVCLGAGRADGMPVVFDREIDAPTLQAGDFRVLTRSGKVGKVTCVTLFPALDPGELRTALLVGEFGSALSDPPASVEIIGNVYSASRSVNYKSTKVSVTPLDAGPSLVLAQVLAPALWQLGKQAGIGRGVGSGCPVGTAQIVRVVWAGGVVKVNGEELADAERKHYQVLLEKGDGSRQNVTPFALADLGDGDNNHLLCLDIAGTPRQVSFPAGHLVDPNGDRNPATMVVVSLTDLP